MTTQTTDRPYLFLFDQPNGREAALALAQEIERRGYPGLWIPSRGDNLALSLAVLERTQRITVGTGIANIYLRHPQVMAEAASLIEELHPRRFTLGIGVSHGPMHARFGLTPGKPLGDTRRYVERMREAVAATEGRNAQPAAPFPRLVLAALRRKMTALSAEIAEGAIWANGICSHLPASLQEIPPGKRDDPDRFLVGNLVVTSISDDRDEAYEWARRGLLTYFRLPNYLHYFEEAGYHDEAAAARAAMDRGGAEQDLLAAISDRFIEDSCLVGAPAQAREQAAAFRDAGVHQLVLTPHSPRGRDAAIEAIFRTFD